MVVFWVKMGNWKRNQRRNYNYESPRSHHTGPAPRPPPHPGINFYLEFHNLILDLSLILMGSC